MNYYFSTTLDEPFEDVMGQVTEALKNEGFGILTTIDVQAVMRQKKGIDMPAYTILGACNPDFAYEALQLEDKVGTMLPCNVIVQQKEKGVEVSAVDPMASMQAIDNPALGQTSHQVRAKLKSVIEHLSLPAVFVG
jgi:uncharacterized protein (DUF302 family)